MGVEIVQFPWSYLILFFRSILKRTIYLEILYSSIGVLIFCAFISLSDRPFYVEILWVIPVSATLHILLLLRPCKIIIRGSRVNAFDPERLGSIIKRLGYSKIECNGEETAYYVPDNWYPQFSENSVRVIRKSFAIDIFLPAPLSIRLLKNLRT